MLIVDLESLNPGVAVRCCVKQRLPHKRYVLDLDCQALNPACGVQAQPHPGHFVDLDYFKLFKGEDQTKSPPSQTDVTGGL